MLPVPTAAYDFRVPSISFFVISVESVCTVTRVLVFALLMITAGLKLFWRIIDGRRILSIRAAGQKISILLNVIWERVGVLLGIEVRCTVHPFWRM